MNILFTICGRAGSKGCKNKNIKEFLGKPLFEYTLNAIDEYKSNFSSNNSIDTVISTDSIEFISLIGKRDAILVINREAHLAGDKTAKMEVIADALRRAELSGGKQYDIIVDLDITSPIRCANDINNAIIKKQSGNFSCVFSVTHARRNPYFNMVTEREGRYEVVLKSSFTTRQEAPIMYDMNASIYAYDRNFLMSGVVSPTKGNCSTIFMKDTGIIDIDNAEDFELMEVLAKYFAENNAEYESIFRQKQR